MSWLLLIHAILKSKENSCPLDSILTLHAGKVPPNSAGKYSPDGILTATPKIHHISISRRSIARSVAGGETAVHIRISLARTDGGTAT